MATLMVKCLTSLPMPGLEPFSCLVGSLTFHQSVCLTVCSGAIIMSRMRWSITSLSVQMSVCLSVYLSVCLSVCLSVYLSVCLSVCLFVCLANVWWAKELITWEGQGTETASVRGARGRRSNCQKGKRVASMKIAKDRKSNCQKSKWVVSMRFTEDKLSNCQRGKCVVSMRSAKDRKTIVRGESELLAWKLRRTGRAIDRKSSCELLAQELQRTCWAIVGGASELLAWELQKTGSAIARRETNTNCIRRAAGRN